MIYILFGYNMPEYDVELRPHRILHQNTSDNETKIEAVRIGPINFDNIPFICNHNPYQQLQGLKKRVMHKQKELNMKVFNRFKLFVKHRIRELEPLPPLEHNESLLEEWLLAYNHPGTRKNQLRRAWSERPGGVLLPKDYRCKTFTKREWYGEKKYARIINPRSDYFIAQVGPYIHKLDEYLFHKSPYAQWFTKGMTIQEQIEAMNQKFSGYGHFVETDYSSFEGSFRVDYQRAVEWQFMRHMLKNNPQALKLIQPCYKSGYNNHLYNPYIGVQFGGSRMSGDVWTSSMNGFSNLMNMLFLCEEHGTNVTGFVEGDDGIFALSNEEIQPEHYSDLGFTIKMDYKANINECEFCCKVFSPDTLTLLGHPRFAGRSGFTYAKRYFRASQRVKNKLYKAECLSFAYMYNGSPILGPYYYAQLKALGNIKEIWIDHWFHQEYLVNPEVNIQKEKPVHMIDRILYEKKYGISIAQQIAFEEWARAHPLEDYHFPIPDQLTYIEGLSKTSKYYQP